MKKPVVNYVKIESFDDFIQCLECRKAQYIYMEGVDEQRQLLGYLIQIFKSDDLSWSLPHLFVFPWVGQFFTVLIGKLDSSLESLTCEAYQSGWRYVASLSNHREAVSVKGLLDLIGEHFPRLQDEYDRTLNEIISNFFRPTLGDFLKQHSDSLEDFPDKYPTVYDLFVKKLRDSLMGSDARLFCFFCNPWIYCPIFEALAEPNDSYSNSWLQKLEEDLQEIKSRTNDTSWEELANKACQLLSSSKDLESFAEACCSLLGEIRAAVYMIHNICDEEDTLIFLEDDNQSGLRTKKKNCDLMIECPSSKTQRFVEVKTKTPRHGVEARCIADRDNFFSNFVNCISSYLIYLEKGGCGAHFFEIGLRKAFPQIFMFEGIEYGYSLPVVSQIMDEPFGADEAPSKRMIENLLRGLFLEPLILNSNPVPQVSEVERKAERHQRIEEVCQKKWVNSVMSKGVEQLEITAERKMRNGYQVLGLHLVCILYISDRLTHDPLSFDDEGGEEDVAASELASSFQRYKCELAKKGYSLDLIPLINP